VIVPVEIAVGNDVADLVEGAVVDQEASSTDCSASIECGGTLRFSSWESEEACDAGWA